MSSGTLEALERFSKTLSSGVRLVGTPDARVHGVALARDSGEEFVGTLVLALEPSEEFFGRSKTRIVVLA